MKETRCDKCGHVIDEKHANVFSFISSNCRKKVNFKGFFDLCDNCNIELVNRTEEFFKHNEK